MINMSDQINMIAVYIADFVGVLLLALILLARGWELPGRKRESSILLILIIATIIDCIIDPFIFIMDGRPGMPAWFIVFFGNSALFLYNLVLGAGVLTLVTRHIQHRVTRMQKFLVVALTLIETVLLIINIFVPIVFSVDENNVYSRRPLYFVYILAASILITYAIVVYLRERGPEGSLRYFPVWEFVIPIICGVVIQTVIYGVSSQPVCFAIAFCSIVINLQKEYLYVDKLTGVYNRYELDKIIKHLKRSGNRKFGAIMLDLNEFKSINDNYSHKEGDSALQVMADILIGVIGNDGNVIRFAGDEFVIITNSHAEQTVSDICTRIRAAVDAYNGMSGKQYKLSASIGAASFDIDDNEDFIDKIDNLMYEDKKDYYSTHDRRR